MRILSGKTSSLVAGLKTLSLAREDTFLNKSSTSSGLKNMEIGVLWGKKQHKHHIIEDVEEVDDLAQEQIEQAQRKIEDETEQKVNIENLKEQLEKEKEKNNQQMQKEKSKYEKQINVLIKNQKSFIDQLKDMAFISKNKDLKKKIGFGLSKMGTKAVLHKGIKHIPKATADILGKMGVKNMTRQGGLAFGKRLALPLKNKAIPFAGLMFGLYAGYKRSTEAYKDYCDGNQTLYKKNRNKALAEIFSGVLSCSPGAGTVVSLCIDGYLMYLDLEEGIKFKQIANLEEVKKINSEAEAIEEAYMQLDLDKETVTKKILDKKVKNLTKILHPDKHVDAEEIQEGLDKHFHSKYR